MKSFSSELQIIHITSSELEKATEFILTTMTSCSFEKGAWQWVKMQSKKSICTEHFLYQVCMLQIVRRKRNKLLQNCYKTAQIRISGVLLNCHGSSLIHNAIRHLLRLDKIVICQLHILDKIIHISFFVRAVIKICLGGSPVHVVPCSLFPVPRVIWYCANVTLLLWPKGYKNRTVISHTQTERWNLIFYWRMAQRMIGTENPYIEDVLDHYSAVPDLTMMALGSSYWGPPEAALRLLEKDLCQSPFLWWIPYYCSVFNSRTTAIGSSYLLF